jgi:hypothetical protein
MSNNIRRYLTFAVATVVMGTLVAIDAAGIYLARRMRR